MHRTVFDFFSGFVWKKNSAEEGTEKIRLWSDCGERKLLGKYKTWLSWQRKDKKK